MTLRDLHLQWYRHQKVHQTIQTLCFCFVFFFFLLAYRCLTTTMILSMHFILYLLIHLLFTILTSCLWAASLYFDCIVCGFLYILCDNGLYISWIFRYECLKRFIITRDNVETLWKNSVTSNWTDKLIGDGMEKFAVNG